MCMGTLCTRSSRSVALLDAFRATPPRIPLHLSGHNGPGVAIPNTIGRCGIALLCVACHQHARVTRCVHDGGCQPEPGDGCQSLPCRTLLWCADLDDECTAGGKALPCLFHQPIEYRKAAAAAVERHARLVLSHADR